MRRDGRTAVKRVGVPVRSSRETQPLRSKQVDTLDPERMGTRRSTREASLSRTRPKRHGPETGRGSASRGVGLADAPSVLFRAVLSPAGLTLSCASAKSSICRPPWPRSRRHLLPRARSHSRRLRPCWPRPHLRLLRSPSPHLRRHRRSPRRSGTTARAGRGKVHLKSAHTSVQDSRSSPAFPARWVYGLCRALPGDEFLLPPSPTD